MKSLKFVAILLVVVALIAAVACAGPTAPTTPKPTTPKPTTPAPTTPAPTTPAPTTPAPTTPAPTTPAPTTPAPTTPAPSGLTTVTVTDTDCPGRGFSIGVPTGWTSDNAARAEKQEYYKKVMVSGYTLVGACCLFYRSPAKDAYLIVTNVDSPLPLTVDRVISGSTQAMKEERYPGYKDESTVETIDKMNAILKFTCNDGTALQLQHINLVPQVAAVTIIAKGAAFDQALFTSVLKSYKDQSSLL